MGRIVYGAEREDGNRLYWPATSITLDFVAEAYRDDLSIEGGFCVKCARLYWRRWDVPPETQKANL